MVIDGIKQTDLNVSGVPVGKHSRTGVTRMTFAIMPEPITEHMPENPAEEEEWFKAVSENLHNFPLTKVGMVVPDNEREDEYGQKRTNALLSRRNGISGGDGISGIIKGDKWNKWNKGNKWNKWNERD